MAGTLPPLFTITPDDHAGYIAVSLYTFVVLMVCLVVTRVFTRWYVVRYIKMDDILLSLAAVRATPLPTSSLCMLTQISITVYGHHPECPCADGPQTWLGSSGTTRLCQRLRFIPEGRSPDPIFILASPDLPSTNMPRKYSSLLL
jgi:hypothetical protein